MIRFQSAVSRSVIFLTKLVPALLITDFTWPNSAASALCRPSTSASTETSTSKDLYSTPADAISASVCFSFSMVLPTRMTVAPSSARTSQQD